MFKNFDIIFYPPSYPRSSYKKGVGGVEVNERHLEALAQYDLVADNVRKVGGYAKPAKEQCCCRNIVVQ